VTDEECMSTEVYALSITTQGPLYPPSELLDAHGNFVVVGRIPRVGAAPRWGAALVSQHTVAPRFGDFGSYEIVRPLDLDALGDDADLVLHTLPLPLPANNYPMLFAPAQRPQAKSDTRPSYPLHQAPIPDLRLEDGRRATAPITLGNWCRAAGELEVTVDVGERTALFQLELAGLVPDSLYTVMSLRERDLDPSAPTRPGPLGIPNVFMTDARGDAHYWARLPNPFPSHAESGANRVINVIILYMSAQMSHGGAIGLYGLGGDIHAQLKLQQPSFGELRTHA
jgi:hypothetical protein